MDDWAYGHGRSVTYVWRGPRGGFVKTKLLEDWDCEYLERKWAGGFCAALDTPEGFDYGIKMDAGLDLYNRVLILDAGVPLIQS